MSPLWTEERRVLVGAWAGRGLSSNAASRPLADSRLCVAGSPRGEFVRLFDWLPSVRTPDIRVLRRCIELRTLAIVLVNIFGSGASPGLMPSVIDSSFACLKTLISALLSPIAHCSISCSLSRLRCRYSMKASSSANDMHNKPTTTPIMRPSLPLIPLAPAELRAAVLAVLGALTAGVR